MIIDTHCHYNMPPLFQDGDLRWKDHWQKAQVAGVIASVVIGVDYETSQRSLELAGQEPRFKASVGFHPHAVGQNLLKNTNPLAEITQWVRQLDTLLIDTVSRENIVGIGETGLDYFQFDASSSESKTEKALQEQLFIEQITLADTYDLPLIIHVRDRGTRAYSDVLSLIKAHKRSNKPFILHCVSGPLSYIAEAISLGAYIGIAGNCTYKNADLIREIIAFSPKDRLLLETDAPYLPPMPHRGKICEPWMIQLTADYIEKELGCSLEQILSNTYQVFPQLKNHE